MTTLAPSGWLVAPSDERLMQAAQQLADDKVSQFNAYNARTGDPMVALIKRQQLRDRMGRIITLDRADTDRSIAASD